MADRLPLDDPEAQARAAWRIAGDICTCEGGYHRIHPLLHAVGAMTGIASDRKVLDAILPDLITPGCRILVAGAADATLVHFLISRAQARPISISVVDRCEAPLRLIEQLELPNDVTVDTRQVDLTRLDEHDRYDLILSHSMLPFVSDPIRVEILHNLGASLTPHGRLLIVGRVTQSTYQPTPDEVAQAMVRRAEARLVDFPDLVRFCGPALPAALKSHAKGLTSGSSGFSAANEISDLILRAGLRIDQHIPSGTAPSLIMPDGSERHRSGHVFVVARSA